MKKIYAFLMMALMAISASAATADWYLYIWSDNQNAGGDAGQFVTTETDGVFLLEGCALAEEGLRFCIRNGAWSEMYGWSDEEGGGSVEATGTAVKLATANSANGWVALPAGNYEVTWNANDKTITFVEATSESVVADWFIYCWDDATSNGGDQGQFKTTETDGEYLLENFEMTTGDGLKFCIHNSAWSSIYGWGWVEGTEGGAVTETDTNVLLEASNTASAWLGLPVGKYNVTWNANALTIRFDSTETTGIHNTLQNNLISRVYSIDGRSVKAGHKGIVIENGKKMVIK